MESTYINLLNACYFQKAVLCPAIFVLRLFNDFVDRGLSPRLTGDPVYIDGLGWCRKVEI